MIEINITLVYQIIAYFILLFVLTKLLFNPVKATLDERRLRTEGALKGAADTIAAVEKGKADYEKRLKEAAQKAQEERAAVRSAAAAVEAELIEKTRKDVQTELQKMRAELTAAKTGAINVLKAETPALSRSIAEKLIGRNVAILVAVLAALLSPDEAFASGGQGNTDMYWKIGNFILLVIGGVVVWRKWIKGALEARANEIKRAIEDADKARAEAEAKLKEYEAKAALLDAKMAEIRQTIKEEAEAERARMMKEAAEVAEKLKEQAKLTAEQELKKAKIEIRKEVAELAVAATKELVSREIKPDDQSRLVKEYVEKMRIN